MAFSENDTVIFNLMHVPHVKSANNNLLNEVRYVFLETGLNRTGNVIVFYDKMH